CVRRLKPRPRILEISVDRILVRELIVHSIENVRLISFVVNRLKFRWIEKAPGFQSICRDEVAPSLIAVGQVETYVGRTKAAIRGNDASSRLRHSQTGFRCYLDHQTGLIAKFRR